MILNKAKLFICILFTSIGFAQQLNESFINYTNPKKYKIGGISVSGTQYLDPSAIIAITGFKVGDEIQIPGDVMTNALKKLWDQGILGDIQVRVSKIEGDQIFFDFFLKERPRLNKFVFFGVKKSEEEDLREKIKLIKGKVVTDVMIKNTQRKVKKFYSEKGYSNAKINILQAKDSNNISANSVTLRIVVAKGRKIRTNKVIFDGNTEYKDEYQNRKQNFDSRFEEFSQNLKYLFKPKRTAFSDSKLRARFKNTRNFNLVLFRARKKFVREKYEEDKKKLIEYYQSKGYRDANIISDTVTADPFNKRFVNVKVKLEEGRKYYFRNINWTGNYIYTDKYLNDILGVKKGDIYNMALLEKRLNYNPTGADVSSLYLDDGYLFYSVEPNEVNIEGDSIDIEMKMYEGPQATINKITVNGNTKTNDRVILREIRTRPGQKFSRADLIRTQREISTLGFFDPEQISINPKPNPANGTVDIDYGVAEKPSDQLELSGGWGGFYGFIGTLGVSFNNFAARHVLNFKKWSPLPSGDGQKLSLRIQANGPSFQSYSASFSEPWLGGRKPTALTVSASYSVSRLGGFLGVGGGFGFNTQQIQNLTGRLAIFNTSISLGRRVQWPDDYFTLSHSLSYSNYNLENYNFRGVPPNGSFNSIVVTNTLSRNSIDNPIYPSNGSSLTFSLFSTPPWSFFSGVDYSKQTPEANLQQFKWIEYYKMNVDLAFYMNFGRKSQVYGSEKKDFLSKLVLVSRAHFGFIGKYNSKANYTPFERFNLGGNGLSGFNFLLGTDIIGLRGYQNNSIGPSFFNPYNNQQSGGIVFNKFVMELRYPITTSQMATIYVLAFAEGGNSFGYYEQYNPFDIKKSAGLGARIFMPAFGLIGVDYGWPFDLAPYEAPQNFTFTIGQQIR
ncbi:MAG: POTRA domain-containing protein [Bacteroidota bacterium]|nr:POTRA domain-containing protein [Bacteroidota bacterium]